MNDIHSLVLCGFMGSGKTTVGREVARLLGWRFTDMDKLIATRAGLSVAGIFARFGEAHFRALERQTAAELAALPHQIIAAGGGVLLDPANVDAFRRNHCAVILLDVSLSIIETRLRGDTSRPLLNTPDREGAMRHLYNARLPLYRAAADHTVDADGSPLPVAQAICRVVQAYGAKGSQTEGEEPVYRSEYCDVDYDEKRNIALVSWKKFCRGDDYRRPLLYALDIMGRHEGCQYVADTRRGFENDVADTQWLFDVFLPRAAQTTCNNIFFIIDRDHRLKKELGDQSIELQKFFRVHYCFGLDEVQLLLADPAISDL